MYQGTQNTLSDNVIVDPERYEQVVTLQSHCFRDEKKMNALKRDLYARHRCEEFSVILA